MGLLTWHDGKSNITTILILHGSSIPGMMIIQTSATFRFSIGVNSLILRINLFLPIWLLLEVQKHQLNNTLKKEMSQIPCCNIAYLSPLILKVRRQNGDRRQWIIRDSSSLVWVFPLASDEERMTGRISLIFNKNNLEG